MAQAPEESKKQDRISRQKNDWFLLSSLLGAAIYLYVSLFYLPRTPFLLGGDQVYFWMDAQRLLHGEQIYRDFFQFTPPGTDLIYAALFKLFGLRLWVTNATVLILGVSLFWICFALASELMERSCALLAASLFLVITYGKMLNGTHHWFATLAVMCAIKLNMRTTIRSRLLAAGLLLGLASFFTQTRGVAGLIGFIVFLTWERSHTNKPWKTLLQSQGLLLFGFLSSLLLLNAHFIAATGLKQLWYFQVVYVRQYLGRGTQDSFLGLPQAFAWHSAIALSQYLAVYTVVFVAYPVALWRCWRERDNPLFPWPQAVLLSIVGLSLLMEVLFSLNWLRLYSVSMPAIILFLWLAGRTFKVPRYALTTIWVGLSCLVIAQTVSRYRHESSIAKLPGGTIATSPAMYEKLHWLADRTHPGQFVFQVAWPGIYLPLEVRNPAYIDILSPGVATPPTDVPLTIRQLDTKHVQYLLWSPTLDRADTSVTHSTDLAPLRDYLHSHYSRMKVFSDGDSAWARNEHSNDDKP